MPIAIIEEQIEKTELVKIAQERFGDLVKAVVDVQRSIMIVGAELHSDEEVLLLDQGSQQQDLWGINRPLAQLRFCRFSGSFEPIFEFFLRGLYQLFVYYPRKKNRKAAKIIPKIDEPLVTQEV